MSAPPQPPKVIYVEAEAVSAGGVPTPPPRSTNAGSSNPAPTATHCNEIGAREYLGGHKWPVGLQTTSINNLAKIPIRFFICDDSGSMIASDGHRLMTTAAGVHK